MSTCFLCLFFPVIRALLSSWTFSWTRSCIRTGISGLSLQRGSMWSREQLLLPLIHLVACPGTRCPFSSSQKRGVRNCLSACRIPLDTSFSIRMGAYTDVISTAHIRFPTREMSFYLFRLNLQRSQTFTHLSQYLLRYSLKIHASCTVGYILRRTDTGNSLTFLTLSSIRGLRFLYWNWRSGGTRQKWTNVHMWNKVWIGGHIPTNSIEGILPYHDLRISII